MMGYKASTWEGLIGKIDMGGAYISIDIKRIENRVRGTMINWVRKCMKLPIPSETKL